jgi:superoxide dismutase, Fe-Mn family
MYTLPTLPYQYDALEPFIDTETMHIHHDKHHDIYTNNLNETFIGHDDISSKPIEDVLSDLSMIPEVIREKVRNFGGGYYNHSFFWLCMSATHNQTPGELVGVEIEKTFGGFSAFQDQFSTMAVKHFGSGWVWLTLDEKGLHIEETNNQDTPLSEGKMPLLGLDLWEHAYYLKYRQARSEYVKQWWHVVDWKHVEELYRKK